MNYIHSIWMILFSISMGVFSYGIDKEFKHVKHELKKIEMKLDNLKELSKK